MDLFTSINSSLTHLTVVKMEVEMEVNSLRQRKMPKYLYSQVMPTKKTMASLHFICNDAICDFQ